MADGFHFGSLGLPELLLILVIAVLSVGWRTFRRR